MTVADIIGLWPNAEAFASDIGLKIYSHGRTMRARNSIPPAHWPAVLAAAELRGFSLTEEQLKAAHADKLIRGKPKTDEGEAA